MSVEPEFRTWVEISRAQIARNFRAVRELVGPRVEVAAVLKADAYGHGAVEAARVLEAEGTRWFAVSTVEEGVTLREAGIGGRILVMADSLPFSRCALLSHRLTPVVHSLRDLAELDRWLQARGASLSFHLKVDSGMGRLGVMEGAEQIAGAVSQARCLRLEGIMSHLASAADYGSPQTEEQIRRFDQLLAALRRAGLAPRYAHLASTIPVAYGRREAWYDMVRTGHALYGYVSPARGPAPPKMLQVQPALSWKARVLAVKTVPAGWPIGYGAMFRAPKPMRIGVLGVGYADGLPHRLSNRGQVIAAGRLARILGAVSMDLTTIDLSQCPEIGPGDAVTLIGCEGQVSQDAQQLARLAGTISYDVLCGIRARVKRVWI
ncbi:MAG: alanine racemase [Bryobacteraceae bacterium]